MHLYLIRHGQSFVNLKDWEEGNKDEGLTDLGRRQADALGAWIGDHIKEPDVIYCSTMRRARETVRPVAAAYGEMAVQYDDRIREIGNNRINHEPFPNDDLPEYSGFWASTRPFAPLSESYEDTEARIHFRARVGAFIEEIAEKHQEDTVIVVCHGGVIDMVFDHVFDIGLRRGCEVWTKNTAVTYFEYIGRDRASWRLYFHNSIDHLRDLQST